MKNERMGFESSHASDLEQMEGRADFETLNQELNSTDVTVYEELNNTRPEARVEYFADSSLEHPRNEYGKLNPAQVARNLQTIERVREELEDADISDKQKRFLELILESDRKKNDFLAANLAYNAAETPEDKADAAEYHREANEALYGKPDEDTFYSLLGEELDKIDVENLRPSDREIYNQLLVALGPMKAEVKPRYQPRPETKQRFAEMANEFYGSLFDAIHEGQEKFTAQEAADIVNQILADNYENTAYHASVAPNSTIASVDHITRAIKFPGKRVAGDYSRKDLKQILAHELGVHTLRAAPYEDQPITAFSRELPDNETWDEGVAKAMEYAVAGEEMQEAAVKRYIGIGLANLKGKNFREVLDIQSTIDFLAGATPDETDDARAERMQKIQQKHFNDVQRCFRGTGELPNNKDLAYYNGSEMVWKYIEEHLDDPELFTNLFLAGKTVATDKDQERLVYEMHVGGLK